MNKVKCQPIFRRKKTNRFVCLMFSLCRGFYFIFQFHHCVFDSADLVSPRISFGWCALLLLLLFFFWCFAKAIVDYDKSAFKKKGLSNICLSEYDTNKCLFLKSHAKKKKKKKEHAHSHIYIIHPLLNIDHTL